MTKNTTWQSCSTAIFWGEIAPHDHLVQIYENDGVFLDTLEEFVKDGFKANDCVVLIATAVHLKAIAQRFKGSKFNLDALIAKNKYIPYDAEKALGKFLVDGLPNKDLFMDFVIGILSPARENDYKVRAFGEMVALLWEKGNTEATMMLEGLWDEFCKSEAFCLFCAYPKNGFKEDVNKSMESIYATHSKIINGSISSSNEILYSMHLAGM